MGFFSNLFKSKQVDSYSSNDINAIASQAQRLVEIINESLTLSNESNNLETKISRLKLAKEKLADINKLANEYSFLSLTSLQDVEDSISKLEMEYLVAGYADIANGNETAEALEKEGKVEESIIVYEKLARRKVSTPFTYRRLAILYRKAKNKNEEIRILEEALNNVPPENAKHYSWFQDRLIKLKNS